MQLIFEDCGEMAISNLLKRYLEDAVQFAEIGRASCRERV